MFHLFDQFETEFTRIFDIFNEKQTTKQIIQYLIQKILASNYAVKFQNYFNFTK